MISHSCDWPSPTHPRLGFATEVSDLQQQRRRSDWEVVCKRGVGKQRPMKTWREMTKTRPGWGKSRKVGMWRLRGMSQIGFHRGCNWIKLYWNWIDFGKIVKSCQKNVQYKVFIWIRLILQFLSHYYLNKILNWLLNYLIHVIVLHCT